MIYGLGAVRGVGEGPVDAIVTARAAAEFTDLADFCQRLDAKKVNKRVLEALINAGAMDDFALADEGLTRPVPVCSHRCLRPFRVLSKWLEMPK